MADGKGFKACIETIVEDETIETAQGCLDDMIFERLCIAMERTLAPFAQKIIADPKKRTSEESELLIDIASHLEDLADVERATKEGGVPIVGEPRVNPDDVEVDPEDEFEEGIRQHSKFLSVEAFARATTNCQKIAAWVKNRAAQPVGTIKGRTAIVAEHTLLQCASGLVDALLVTAEVIRCRMKKRRQVSRRNSALKRIKSESD